MIVVVRKEETITIWSLLEQWFMWAGEGKRFLRFSHHRISLVVDALCRYSTAIAQFYVVVGWCYCWDIYRRSSISVLESIIPVDRLVLRGRRCWKLTRHLLLIRGNQLLGKRWCYKNLPMRGQKMECCIWNINHFYSRILFEFAKGPLNPKMSNFIEFITYQTDMFGFKASN